MITKKLLSNYFEHYHAVQAPFMHQQLAEWNFSKPLKNLRVIHHVPLVPNTLLKIACLITAGADVTVTNPNSFMAAHPDAIACLRAENIRYVDDVNTLCDEIFDIHFDCGAELYQILGKPRLGAIELTGSGDILYRAQREILNYPVISIDQTLTKQLETVFGSAESASLAIQQACKINPAEKSWLIFGFGKIARGLAYFCVKHKTPVTIVEVTDFAKNAARALGLNVIDAHDHEAIQSALKQADIVITATGQKAIMNAYSKQWFNGKILANMGIYDEFGEQFLPEEVLNNKAPVNFLLHDPTPMKYIDPEFYSHNIAALPLLQAALPVGFHDVSADIDKSIIQRWCDYHQVPLAEIQRWFIQFN